MPGWRLQFSSENDLTGSRHTGLLGTSPDLNVLAPATSPITMYISALVRTFVTRVARSSNCKQQQHQAAAMAFSIEQLPKSWLLRFVELLNNHIKLSLRQSSLGMLKLVDSNPTSRLTWQIPNTLLSWRDDPDDWFDEAKYLSLRTAADLCAETVVHMDMCRARPDFNKHLSRIDAISLSRSAGKVSACFLSCRR
jgi:hypothetical protein